ncbi:MAG: ureidoglycolate lyase [Aestuariivirga sp.]
MIIDPLTREAFAPFGDVIEMSGAEIININQNFAQRFNDLAQIDVTSESGTVNISLAVAMPRPQPIAIKLMERHPLGSQIFYPLQDEPWLVLVCTNPRDPASYRAFKASGRQGINYARNAWHHPLLVLKPQRFFVVDRKGPGNNLEELWLDKPFDLAP